MISHDFTIILGVREKISRTPTENVFFAYPLREILASPRRPQKPNPQLEGYAYYATFFRAPGRNVQNEKTFSYPVRDFRATSVQECRVDLFWIVIFDISSCISVCFVVSCIL